MFISQHHIDVKEGGVTELLHVPPRFVKHAIVSQGHCMLFY